MSWWFTPLPKTRGVGTRRGKEGKKKRKGGMLDNYELHRAKA
jgi:hypothetical protein